MSDTLETDRELAELGFGFYTMGGLPADAVKVEFARKLERERDDLRNELNDTIRLSLIWEDGYRALLDERDYWKAEAERWKEVAK